MKHLGTKRIETPRLVLRRFRPEDAQAMFDNWASDDEVTKYLTWPSHTDIGVSKWVVNDWVASYDNGAHHMVDADIKLSDRMSAHVQAKIIEKVMEKCGVKVGEAFIPHFFCADITKTDG